MDMEKLLDMAYVSNLDIDRIENVLKDMIESLAVNGAPLYHKMAQETDPKFAEVAIISSIIDLVRDPRAEIGGIAAIYIALKFGLLDIMKNTKADPKSAIEILDELETSGLASKPVSEILN